MDAANTNADRRALVRCPFCLKLNRVTVGRAQDRPKCGDCGKPILIDRPVAVGDAELERVIAETDVPVVVDFYADWCAPCRVMAPMLDEIARLRLGEVLITKLDTDRNPTMAARFGIRGIPTLIVFKGGQEVARQVGVSQRAQLDRILDDAIAA